jgi:hypothetical protein
LNKSGMRITAETPYAMQSPKFSLAGCPLALPNLSNAREAASAISPLKGTTTPRLDFRNCSSQLEDRAARLIEHHARVSTRVGADRAFFAGEKIEQWLGVSFALDDSD